MKVIALLLVAIVVCAQAAHEDEVLQKWTKFQADFGRTYRSPVEARTRFNIFKDNLKSIEAHNALFEEGQTSYKKGINRFSDWTHEEFVQYLNKSLINKASVSGTPFKKSPNFVAPTSVDWRTKNVVTEVKDQGQCGSCWAFSTTGAIEGQLGLKGQLVSLSEQNLMDCSWDDGNMGCGGGLPTYAYNYVVKSGIESEADYPYIEDDGTCNADPKKVVTKLTGYTQIEEGSDDALVEAIATKGPISIGMDASNLSDYDSGIYDDSECDPNFLDHGVLAVGYGSENGKDFYIVKNSWGADWGEQGYFRILKNNNLCGVVSLATLPKLA